MDGRAFYAQAAEAAATLAVRTTAEGDAAAKVVLVKLFEGQGVGLGCGAAAAADGAAPRHGSGGGALVGVDVGDKACCQGGGDLICPECGKIFLSDKAMYGHLRCHPERGYKGATRPSKAGPATALLAGGVKARKVPLKEGFLSERSPAAGLKVELSTKWPVTARRGRTLTAAYADTAGPAAVLEPTRSEEEEAAMILLWMSSGDATLLEPAKLHMQLMHASDAVELDFAPETEVEQPMMMPEHAAGAGAGQHVCEAEKPAEVDLPLQPVAAKKTKKRRLDDLVQMPPNPMPAAEAAEVEPPLRHKPSPASDRKYVCPTCGKSFPTHQALGGHMASHKRISKLSGEQQLEGCLAVAHTLHNIMAEHHQRQEGAVVPAATIGLGAVWKIPPPLPAPRDPELHPCSRCSLVFRSGQALGGHTRKHWLAERRHREAAASAAALAEAAARPIVSPRDFDLNELPVE